MTVVTAMLDALQLRPDDRVLAIGADAKLLAALGSRAVFQGDASTGLPEHAPYDAIVVIPYRPTVPNPLLAQLAERGRLVIPVGDEDRRHLIKARKVAVGQCTLEDLGPLPIEQP